jgi:hypothetical protein
VAASGPAAKGASQDGRASDVLVGSPAAGHVVSSRVRKVRGRVIDNGSLEAENILIDAALSCAEPSTGSALVDTSRSARARGLASGSRAISAEIVSTA